MGVWTTPEGTFTIEEFKRLPLEGRRWELLDGHVVQMEPHSFETSILTSRLMVAMGNHVDDRRLGYVLGPGCGFRSWPDHETVRVTDMSFTRSDLEPRSQFDDDFPRFAPDLIVEVFSPFERLATVLGRIAMFLQAGTTVAWFVNPVSQAVTVFAQNSPINVIRGGEMLDGAEILPAFRISIAAISI